MRPLRFLAPTLAVSFLLSVLSIPSILLPRAEAQTELDADRIEQLAAMLPESPRGVGRPADDRETWKALARLEEFRSTIGRAESVMDDPMPELTDDLFLDFSRTGNRSRCQSFRATNQHGHITATL